MICQTNCADIPTAAAHDAAVHHPAPHEHRHASTDQTTHRPNDPPTDPSIDSFIHPFVRSWNSQSDQPRAEGSASQKEEEPKGDQGKSSPTRGAERTTMDMDARIPSNDSTTSSIQSNPHLLSFSPTLLHQPPTHLFCSPYSSARRSMV